MGEYFDEAAVVEHGQTRHGESAQGESPMPASGEQHSLLGLQRAAGNQTVAELVEGDKHPVKDVVNSAPGRGLDHDTRTGMEKELGADFGDVRIHTDPAASDSAKSVQAQAYTVGNNVVFREGGYQPTTPAGRRTLAHELTHVVQQRSGPVDGTNVIGGIRVSDPSDRFEQEAERKADRVSGRASEGPSPVSPTGVQRLGDGNMEPSVQRESALEEKEEDLEQKVPVQRQQELENKDEETTRSQT